MDSGVADPVMPRRMLRGRGNKIRSSQASRVGVHYVSATASRVNKVFVSVSYFVDDNHRVVFDQDLDTSEDISLITNKTDGETIKMRRDRRVWVIDAYIEEDIEQGFTRPEQAP